MIRILNTIILHMLAAAAFTSMLSPAFAIANASLDPLDWDQASWTALVAIWAIFLAVIGAYSFCVGALADTRVGLLDDLRERPLPPKCRGES